MHSQNLAQFGSRSRGQDQKFSYPDNRCPRGYDQTGSGSDGPPRGYSPPWGDFVMCKPTPPPQAAPAPAPVAGPTYTTTISPVLQTEVSPQISPVFQQTQDSPGAVQAGSPTQFKPGGMEATGGGSGPAGNGSAAMLEFMRMQSEQDAARRAEDAKMREQDRRERAAREEKAAQAQRESDALFQQRQLELQAQEQQRAELARQQQLEMQRLEMERNAAAEAGRVEEAAALQAQYDRERAAWEQTSAGPSTYVSTPGAMPGAPAAGPVALPPPPDKAALPLPLIVAGVAAVLVGGYFYATQPKKGKAKK